jgi:hypothetical protein
VREYRIPIFEKSGDIGDNADNIAAIRNNVDKITATRKNLQKILGIKRVCETPVTTDSARGFQDVPNGL